MASKLSLVKKALEGDSRVTMSRIRGDAPSWQSWGNVDYQVEIDVAPATSDVHYGDIRAFVSSLFGEGLVPDTFSIPDQAVAGYQPSAVKFEESIGRETRKITLLYPEEFPGEDDFMDGIRTEEIPITRSIWVIFHWDQVHAMGESKYEDLPQ